MKEAKAFSPCHITGFFQIFDKPKNPLHVGSRGAGVSLKMGVETIVKIEEATTSTFQVSINGVFSSSAEVSRHLLNMFLSRFNETRSFKILVDHYVNVPVGAGFGTSGAATLSLALALNEAFNLDMSKIEAAQLAHIAEVECKTGLGTVIAETFGGVEIRVKPGAPGIGEIEHVNVQKDSFVACLVFGSLSTREFLTDNAVRERINNLGGKLVDKLVGVPTVSNFTEFSRSFADYVGLATDDVRKIFDVADKAGFVVSMPMFGNAVFTICDKGSIEDVLSLFREYASQGQIVVSEIDFEGARVTK